MALDPDPGWNLCLERLEGELAEDEMERWIRPLQARREGDRLLLLAPDRMVTQRVLSEFRGRIQQAWRDGDGSEVQVEVITAPESAPAPAPTVSSRPAPSQGGATRLDPRYTFESFIQGKSNAQATAAAQQVAESPGVAYNPLLIYGASGLGKTHLMHAAGNALLSRGQNVRVMYMPSEQWMNEFISALRHNTSEEFKSKYRTADALLIDDIQFFAKKTQTQEEFFHTFNSLMDGRKQIILTCDRYPKDLDEMEDRLKSRFSSGLTVSVEPPDLETRVAILLSKAEQFQLELSNDVAFFVAQHVRSNVRELEGVLLRLSAGVRLQGAPITVDFARQTLRELLAHYERKVTIENIMSTVAKYYGIPPKELRSARRSRMLARPRQMAMALARELTEHSLPDIGQAFEKDHTTVLHADRKIKELRETESKIRDDWENLLRQLSY